MNIRICDGNGCSNAYVSTDGYTEPKNRVGWTMTSRVEEVDEQVQDLPRPKLKDPDLVHGEVTIDGKQVPFVIHKPAEIKALEEEHDAFMASATAPRRSYTERRIELCPSCSPRLPEIKREALDRR